MQFMYLQIVFSFFIVFGATPHRASPKPSILEHGGAAVALRPLPPHKFLVRIVFDSISSPTTTPHPPLGLGLMSWINACHASTQRGARRFPTRHEPPPPPSPHVPLPTVFTLSVEELEPASRLRAAANQQTPSPPPPPREEIDRFSVHWSESTGMSHLAVTCKRQRTRPCTVQLH